MQWHAYRRAFQTKIVRYDGPMLNSPDIDTIAAEVARINLPSGALLSAESRPYEGPYGGDELMVTINISDSLFPEVTGRQFNRIVGDLQQELIARGEMRFANIEWKTDAPPLSEEGEDGERE